MKWERVVSHSPGLKLLTDFIPPVNWVYSFGALLSHLLSPQPGVQTLRYIPALSMGHCSIAALLSGVACVSGTKGGVSGNKRGGRDLRYLPKADPATAREQLLRLFLLVWAGGPIIAQEVHIERAPTAV